MNNTIEVKPPSDPLMWSRLTRKLRTNTSKLTNVMGYHNSITTTFNIEDVEPMKRNCEEILQVTSDIYEDIVQMYNTIREINAYATPSPEEWFIRQGEHEQLEKNSL